MRRVGRLAQLAVPPPPQMGCHCQRWRRPCQQWSPAGPRRLVQRTAPARTGCATMSSTAHPSTRVLAAADDRFGGKVVDMASVNACKTGDFPATLQASLQQWRAEQKGGCWLPIPVTRAELLPVAIAAGFELHHTEPDKVVLAAWLKPTPSPLPAYTTHTVGVGAVVINSKRQILAVQVCELGRTHVQLYQLCSSAGCH